MVYLVKVYSILAELIVNTCQTSLHIVPTSGERTWETKSAKHIYVLGMVHKRQVIVVVSTASNGKSLLLQVIIIGITMQSFLFVSVGQEKCI